MLPSKKFAHWLYRPNLAPLFYIADPRFPPTVGKPNPQASLNITTMWVLRSQCTMRFHRGSACRRESLYTIHRGGLRRVAGWSRPRRLPPWLQGFLAALTLAGTASRVSPKLRTGVLKMILEQTSITSAEIKNNIKKLQKK